MLYFKENETGLTPIPSPLFLDDGQVIHLLPVDIDVTPYDESKSHKEGATVTYKNFIGYAPINAHIGMEGFMLMIEQPNTSEILRMLCLPASVMGKLSSTLKRIGFIRSTSFIR